MSAHVREVGPESLPVFAEISASFRVKSVLRVEELDGGLSGLALGDEARDRTYVKDYDEADCESPASWPRRFDLSRWGFFLAFEGRPPVGAAAVAFGTPELSLLKGRQDLAALWDIQVRPDKRGHAIGTLLFQRAAGCARARGCSQLTTETQNVNVPACRFCAKQGCHLGVIHRHGYAGDPACADEAMLIWYLDL
jgi:GNAT superfamily N-acetyltransferase